MREPGARVAAVVLFPCAGGARSKGAFLRLRALGPVHLVLPREGGGFHLVESDDPDRAHRQAWSPERFGRADAAALAAEIRALGPRQVTMLHPRPGGRGCFWIEWAALRSRGAAEIDDGRARPLTPARLAGSWMVRGIGHRLLVVAEIVFACCALATLRGLRGPAPLFGAAARALRRRSTATRVTFLPFYPRSAAGARYRVHHWVERLDGVEGMRCRALDPAGSRFHAATFGRDTPGGRWLYMVAVFFRRLVQLFRVAGDDVVVVRLALFPYFPYGGPAMEALLRRLGPRLILDLDDAIHLYYQPPRGGGPLLSAIYDALRCPERVARSIALADAVIAGNPTLARYAARHRAQAVHVIPTCVDVERYAAAGAAPRRENRDEVLLGWVGTPWNLRHLDTIAAVLATLARRGGVRVRVISSQAHQIPGLAIDNRRWTLEREVADLAELDIGLMPLEEGEEPASKCGFKALQFMACGVPPVVSPIGANAAIVTEGVDGMAPRDAAGWSAALKRLIDDPELRASMGGAARETVARRFSYRAQLPRMVALLREEPVPEDPAYGD